ncbi:MAG: shikimate kinase [Deltaproteobacteria bacterium]|nr:shikimate kinase [Deltaproteobacteria bacterium]
MDEALILTGFMGAGKTATGRALSDLLGWDFVDLDEEVEAAAGKSIPAIFAEDGEARFRDLESEALAGVLVRRRTVVATGGGVLVRGENRKLLEGRRVYYLHVSPGECLRRLRASPVSRPLLAGPDPEAAATRIYQGRRALYESVGRRVETEGRTPEEVAAGIAREVRGEDAR